MNPAKYLETVVERQSNLSINLLERLDSLYGQKALLNFSQKESTSLFFK
jgi:hypothetical protein